jgi:5-methylcytosine-specific restriction protein A
VAKPIPQFRVGKKYDRGTDIHGPFGGSKQSGIAASKVADAIFIFTGESGEQHGYFDKENVDEHGCHVFAYTGEGRVGDMQFSRGNLAILHHCRDGRALHLFRSLGKGKGQKYVGEYVYAGHSLGRGPDTNGAERTVIIFNLVPVTEAAQLEDAASLTEDPDGVAPTLMEARRRAIDAATRTEKDALGQSSTRSLYRRSKAVKDYVMMRANGICESCKLPAPFNRTNGTPYLEPHHTTRLSDGGPDHPCHVGAICPSCHREIHHGALGSLKNETLQAFLHYLEGKT